MKHHHPYLKSAVRLLCCVMVLFPLLASAGDTPTGQVPAQRNGAGTGTWGFEIGNGKRMITNVNGFYGLTTPAGTWQVGFYGKFTELLTSFYDGAPRARLHINLIAAEGIRTFSDLVTQLTGRGFEVAKIAQLEAVSKEDALTNGRCLLDVRVFRAPKEIAVITLDGNRVDASDDCRSPSSYTRIKESLDTFQFIQ